jgi:hypothetical protein
MTESHMALNLAHSSRNDVTERGLYGKNYR